MTTQSQTPEQRVLELSEKATKAPWDETLAVGGGAFKAIVAGDRHIATIEGRFPDAQAPADAALIVAARNLAEPMARVVAAARDCSDLWDRGVPKAIEYEALQDALHQLDEVATND